MKYRLVRDSAGFACAIARGRQWILHLNPGTEFNEMNAASFVAEVNSALRAAKPKPKPKRREPASA